MTRLWRTLAVAAALNIMAAGVAAAQTVLVRNASAGDTVEVVLNGATVASGPVDAAGVAKLSFALPAEWLANGMDSRIYVDNCAKIRRVFVLERNQVVPAAQDGCNRTEITGLYFVRRENTLVVNVAGALPTLLMVKGNFSLKPPSPAPPAPKGLIVYGGGGFSSFADEVERACGNVEDCGGDDAVSAWTGGVSYWITNWLAVDGSYLKPSTPTAAGGGSGLEFKSDIDANVFQGGIKIGVPFSRVRIYGTGGVNFHSATTRTIQSLSGGTQTIVVDSEGLGWQAGGGLEVWATKWFALYAEASKVALKGDALDKTKGEFKDSLNVAMLGGRIRVF